MNYTLERLQAMTAEQRAQLYQNALRRLDGGGKEIVELIDKSGLSLSEGGMRLSDPVCLEMEEIIWSENGRRLVVEATEKGLPALAGVEPLIRDRLGSRYHPHDGGTATAGYIVAMLMRHLGFVDDREGKMPEGSIAKTAMRWKQRKP